jgi:hypothetical protein
MDQLLENWQDGGWGMWPIMLFGIMALLGAGRFAWRGEHTLSAFIRWMMATTGSSAVLGFSAGMHKVFAAVAGNDPRFPELAKEGNELRIRILFEGTKEASNCLSFGLILLTLSCLLVAVGYRRFPVPVSDAHPSPVVP